LGDWRMLIHAMAIDGAAEVEALWKEGTAFCAARRTSGRVGRRAACLAAA